jgi:excisionase family DNA binding protein
MSLQSRYKKAPQTTAARRTYMVPWGARLLSMHEASVYIGHSYDLFTVMIESGEIPHVRKGNGGTRIHKVIDRLDLDAWVEKNKVGETA